MTAPVKRRRQAARRNGTAEVVIPDRLYFRIGEVAKLLGLPAYVLRFWETEFAQLKPVKSSTGQRMYRRGDVENALTIKRLLYDEGFTIAGARQHLKDETRPTKKQTPLPFPGKLPPAELKRIRSGLQEIVVMLSRKR